MERVIEFAELEEFEDLKLKNYSSGMHVRLAFSVMIQVDADVLLIDEILAVGDASFQQKCFDVFFRLRDEGKTIVFVTHDMSAVERFCHRAVLLESGEVVALGEPHEVADRLPGAELPARAGAATGDVTGRGGTGEGARSWRPGWRTSMACARGPSPRGPSCVFGRAQFTEAVRDPVFAVTFVNAQLQNVFVANTAMLDDPAGVYRPGDGRTFTVRFDNRWRPGATRCRTLIAKPGGASAMIDRWENFASIVVTGARAAGGLVDLPHEAVVERVDSETPVRGPRELDRRRRRADRPP